MMGWVLENPGDDFLLFWELHIIEYKDFLMNVLTKFIIDSSYGYFLENPHICWSYLISTVHRSFG